MRKCEAQEKLASTNIKRILFNRVLPYIDRMLAKGDCGTMSDVVQFASIITITPASWVNEPDTLFSSHWHDIQRSTDGRRFWIARQFCESSELKASWQRKLMPAYVLTFFLTAMLNVPKQKLFRNTVENIEELFQPMEVPENDPVVLLLQQPTQEEQQSFNRNNKTGWTGTTVQLGDR